MQIAACSQLDSGRKAGSNLCKITDGAEDINSSQLVLVSDLEGSRFDSVVECFVWIP